jgi:hypothetical protein
MFVLQEGLELHGIENKTRKGFKHFLLTVTHWGCH